MQSPLGMLGVVKSTVKHKKKKEEFRSFKWENIKFIFPFFLSSNRMEHSPGSPDVLISTTFKGFLSCL